MFALARLSLAPLFLGALLFHTSVATYNSCTHDETFIPDAVLRVSVETITQSCMPPKDVLLINGTSPGPELRLTEGRTYWIRVYNDLPNDNTTMHWHGLTMAVSPFSDGTPQASQWPIPPLHFFDYEINIPVGMAGTYFYHSHVGFQAVSATGPLIVEDSGPIPYDYDEEKIIFLQDVFSKDDTTIEQGLVAKPFVWSGESAMILVNGNGGGTSDTTVCNASLSIINVDPKKTYRFRIIGGTALSFVSFAIEGHNTLTIIEADGAYTQPYNTSYLQVGTGQRFSFLLNTQASPPKKTFMMQFEARSRPTVTRGFAVLNYGSEPKHAPYPPATPPMTLPATTVGFLDYVLRPLIQDEPFPTAAQVTRRVTVRVHQEELGGRTVWVENNFPWTEDTPREPYLVSLYKNDGIEFPSMQRALANSGLDPVTVAFPAEIGEVLEIVIQNTGSEAGGVDAHPFHAHGKHYWDIGSGPGTYNAAENEKRLSGTSPVKRDTTMLYVYDTSTSNNTDAGWRAWRLNVVEPGVWMIHCHILQHMIMGMQTVWVFGNETDLIRGVPIPEVEGYLVYGGNVLGNETHWPQVVEFQSDWEDDQ
ncbi:multicopper oxidase-4 [Coleophoma crateriformis]|uniref:Multicopper oxidase-4 n=1 Tax=Coleophoma crateriformis TaxID=565419 RepID=A0A3D8SZ73_9HELO|nr:multicopper oxidase-4 [Coleophoma crateriformis]